MRDIDGLLSWAERRILYRIEADQELARHNGYNSKLTDLGKLVDIQPKAVRAIVSGLIEKEYLGLAHRGRRVFFRLIKPLGGQYRLVWNPETSQSEYVRQY